MKRWSDDIGGTTGADLTLSGTGTAADLHATDDLTVDDDALITGTLTPASGFAGTGPGVPITIAGTFVLADIQAGTKVFTTLPANAKVLGTALRITTALTFSAGTTTDVTCESGTTGDPNGWHPTVALAGVAGYRHPATAGAMLGVTTAGGSGTWTLTFAASAGGAPNLAEVSAGAGTAYLTYCLPASA
jgi:hypothetical protein